MRGWEADTSEQRLGPPKRPVVFRHPVLTNVPQLSTLLQNLQQKRHFPPTSVPMHEATTKDRTSSGSEPFQQPTWATTGCDSIEHFCFLFKEKKTTNRLLQEITVTLLHPVTSAALRRRPVPLGRVRAVGAHRTWCVPTTHTLARLRHGALASGLSGRGHTHRTPGIPPGGTPMAPTGVGGPRPQRPSGHGAGRPAAARDAQGSPPGPAPPPPPGTYRAHTPPPAPGGGSVCRGQYRNFL